MSVRALGSQSAEHDSGVIIGSVDRWTLRATYRARTLLLSVDSGLRMFYLTSGTNGLHWVEDGKLVSESDLTLIRAALTEVIASWGGEAVIEF